MDWLKPWIHWLHRWRQKPHLPPTTVERGAAGEQQALRYLQQHGLRLEKKNHRCRDGEIDLIMHDQNILVFVEVRQRASPAYGGALASIDGSKRRRVSRCAQRYLAAQRRYQQRTCRFDVVTLEADTVTWIQDAWRLDA